MSKIAEGISEMEGVVTAAAHLFAALMTELPEPRRSITRRAITRWIATHLPDREDAAEMAWEEIIEALEPYDKGYVEFLRMVARLDRHFEHDCESYMEERQALLAKHAERRALPEETRPEDHA